MHGKMQIKIARKGHTKLLRLLWPNQIVPTTIVALKNIFAKLHCDRKDVFSFFFSLEPPRNYVNRIEIQPSVLVVNIKLHEYANVQHELITAVASFQAHTTHLCQIEHPPPLLQFILPWFLGWIMASFAIKDSLEVRSDCLNSLRVQYWPLSF